MKLGGENMKKTIKFKDKQQKKDMEHLRKALKKLEKVKDMYFRKFGMPAPEQEAVVDGDALMPAISAASILAKTFRDELMVKLDARWPEYGFAKHKGYGTKEHREALAKFGPCPLHRLDFHGVLPPKKQEQGWLC